MSECGKCKISLACPFVGWTPGQVFAETQGASSYPSKHEGQSIVARRCHQCGAMFIVLQLSKAEISQYRGVDNWLSWQQIELMFDCAIYAMQSHLDRYEAYDCPRCQRWREPSAFERRRREQQKS